MAKKRKKKVVRKSAARKRSKPARAKAMGARKKAGRVRAKPRAKAAGREYSARADLGASPDLYFDGVQGALKEVATRLRAIVRNAAPGAKESIKWGMPVYEHDGMLCYIKARPRYVTLGFYDQGIDLVDPSAALEGTGEQARHVKVASAGDIQHERFSGWVRQAVAINVERAGL